MITRFVTINLKKHFGWLTILILTILPIARWLFMLPLSFRFLDFYALMTSLGQIAGLLGMTLFSLNLILASRLKFLDKYFSGINFVYNYHRAVGALAFSLLLFHPLFLVFKFLPFSLREAALFLLPFTGNPAVTYGIIALALMIVLLVITFYIKIKYHYWKMSHKFMTLVFVFALLHVVFIPSDVSQDYILRYYILVWGAIGLAAGAYRSWLSGFFNKDFYYQIADIKRLNQAVVELDLEPTGRLMEFQAGQFAFLRFKSARLSSESHPFSMASTPQEKNIKFVIKALGDYTGQLENLQIGDRVALAGPFGKFSYKYVANKQQIWLAGGIGIAPFLSMARDLSESDYQIDLFYCTKDRIEAVLIEELENLAARQNNFRIIHWFSDEKGRISSGKIAELSQGLANKNIMLCGPLPFMRNLREQFIKANVTKSQIYWEKFDLI